MTELCLSLHIMGRRRQTDGMTVANTLLNYKKKKIAAQIGSNIAIVFDLSSHQRIGYQWLQGTGHHVGRVTVKMQTALSIGDIRGKKFLTSLYDMSTNSSFATETNNKYNKNSVNGVRSQ